MIPEQFIILDGYAPMRNTVRVRLFEFSRLTDCYEIKCSELHVAIKLRPELARCQKIYIGLPERFTYSKNWWKLVAFDAAKPNILNPEPPKERATREGSDGIVSDCQ